MSNMPPDAKIFLHELTKRGGVAKPQEVGPQTTQAQNAARQLCKRRRYVNFKDGRWEITNHGRAALSAAVE